MTAAILTLLGGALGYALLFRGAVEEPHWRACQSIVAIAAVAAFAGWRNRARLQPLDRRAVWIFLALATYLLFQMIPLPAGLVAVLSPTRAALSSSLAIAGPAPEWITLSAAPSVTLTWSLRWLTAAVLFLLVRQAAARFDRDSWWPVAPVIALVTIQAGIGLVQLTFGAPVQGTAGNRNHFAAALNLAFPLAVGAGASGMTLPAFAIAGLLAAGSLLSLSRTGFLVVAACGAALGLRAVRHRFPPAILGLLAAGMIPAAFALAPGALIERFSGSDGRLGLWGETMGLVRAYPVFGCGLGSYESVFPQFKRMAPERTADFAHNDYLQLLAELGLAGFVMLAAGLYFVFRTLVRGRLNWRRIACLVSLAGAAVHSFTDYPLYVPANLLLFAWLAGVSSVEPPRRRADILPREA